MRALAWGLPAAALLAVTALWLARHTSWYLAVDQFGYLAFGADLRAGRVLHPWPPAEALADVLPRPTDVLAQTYVWDGARLYSRYAPGFPLLVAAWTGVLGADAAHALNPALFVLLLAVVIALGWRTLGSPWHGLAAAALVLVCPTLVPFWALTPTRDLAAHLPALVALLVLLPRRDVPLGLRRLGGAGLAFGVAVAVRPDAVLYAVPAALLVRRAARRRALQVSAARAALAGLAACLAGSAPLLVYDWQTTGNPFVPTQAMEMQGFLPGNWMPAVAAGLRPRVPRPLPPPAPGIAFRPVGWRGGSIVPVQGGGLRLAHFPVVAHRQLVHLARSQGAVLLGFAAVGVAAAACAGRAHVVAATVPYLVAALAFFGCWAQPDPRYLTGVFLLLPLLVVEGTLALPRLVGGLAGAGRVGPARMLAGVAAAALAAGVLFALPAPGARDALRAATLVTAAAAALSLAVALVRPASRSTAPAAILAGALVALALHDGWRRLPGRAPFQRPQVEAARAALAAAVGPGGVVITTEDVGRPAENIEYWADGIHALYLTDLERWRLPLAEAATRLAAAGLRPYLLLPPTAEYEAMVGALGAALHVEVAADVPAARAAEYFVLSPFQPPVRMRLWRLGPGPS